MATENQHPKSDFNRKIEEFAQSIIPEVNNQDRGLIIVAVDATHDDGIGISSVVMGTPEYIAYAIAKFATDPNTAPHFIEGLQMASHLSKLNK